VPIEKGMAFLIPSGQNGKMHLSCILTDQFDGTQRLFVTISTLRDDRYCDKTCILLDEDHPWLRQLSYVAYRHINQRSDAHIQHQIDSNIFIPKEKFDEAVLKRILDNACKSDQIKPFAEKILTENNA